MKIKEFKSKNIEKKLVRNPNSNKGDYGHVLVIAGNLGFGGAALLSSKAVLASGAGLATLATRKDHLSAALAYCPEVMSKTVESISDLENHLPNKTVICIGPGLGRNYWADQMLYKTTNFAAKENLPILIDADGLNILSENRLKIKLTKKLILTPHPGEAARLLKTKVSTIQKNRSLALAKLCDKYNATVILKGHETLIGNKRTSFVCKKGNAGMAVGGMGDVLSGLVSGLIAQGLSSIDAACLGVDMHASAADSFVEKHDMKSLMPSDLFNFIKMKNE